MGLRAVLFFIVAATAVSAQALPNLEIRGRVIEPGLEVGVAGAEVTLIEFVVGTRSTFATAFTDSSGAFRFQPLRLGDYFVEVRKEGYQNGSLGGYESTQADVAEAQVTLTRERPSREFRFSMVRPGEVTGRVLDENRRPITGLRVAVREGINYAPYAQLTAITGEDGSFTVSNVPPRDLFVRITPKTGELARVRTEFAPEDPAIVDHDLEMSFWPGGLVLPSGNPLRVSSGATVSIGTIVARTVPYYRVHVTVPGECADGQKRTFAAVRSDTPGLNSFTIPCTRDFLVENLRPGSYEFALWEGQGRVPANWGLVPVEITSRNLDVELRLSPGSELSGRFRAVEGTQLPALTNVRLLVSFPLGSDTATPDAEGRFVIQIHPWPRRQVAVQGLPAKYYVREMLYNGRAAEQGFVNITPGAQLEIVVDDKAAEITGSVTSGDKPAAEGFVVAAKWPLPPRELYSAAPTAAVIRDGKFQLGGLAPGDYRIFAVSMADGFRLQDWAKLNQFVSQVETTRLGAAESRTLMLKMIR